MSTHGCRKCKPSRPFTAPNRNCTFHPKPTAPTPTPLVLSLSKDGPHTCHCQERAYCHCEERSDVAIPLPVPTVIALPHRDCHAALSNVTNPNTCAYVIALPPVIEIATLSSTVIAKQPPSLRYPLSLRGASLLSLRGAQRRGNPVAGAYRHCATSSRLPRCARNDKPKHPPSLRYPLSLRAASLLSLRGAQRRGNPDASAYCCSPYQSCARSRCSGFNPSISATFRARDHDFICFSRAMASSTLTQSSK